MRPCKPGYVLAKDRPAKQWLLLQWRSANKVIINLCTSSNKSNIHGKLSSVYLLTNVFSIIGSLIHEL